MLPLRIEIQEIGPPDIRKRLLNEIVREGLREAAEFWITHYLPIHFTQSAYSRYQYSARSQRYLAIKARAQKIRPWIGTSRGDWVAAPKPPRPWVWSGETIHQLLGMTPEEFTIKAIATTKKQRVEVKLPVPHPTSPDHKGELGKLTQDEFKQMHEIAFAYIRHELQKIKDVRKMRFNFMAA